MHLPTNELMLAISSNSGYKINIKFDGYDYDITYNLKKSE
jgi:hypothetical protein